MKNPFFKINDIELCINDWFNTDKEVNKLYIIVVFSYTMDNGVTSRQEFKEGIIDKFFNCIISYN